MIKQSVRVSPSTKRRIKQLAVTPRESYEDILNRVLDAKLGNMKIKYSLSDKRNMVYALIDYNQLDPNILFKYEDKEYSNVKDIPISISFKKQLSRLDLFKVLPLLDKGESCMCDEILLENVTGDMR